MTENQEQQAFAYPQGYYPSYYRQQTPYYQMPTFPQQPQLQPQLQQGQLAQLAQQAAPILEQSYIENILRLNKGRMATVYATFENNREWNAKIFKGIIEAAGRDHVILSDPQTQMRYLIPMIYVDYVTFDGEIAYEYPFAGVVNYLQQQR